MHYWLNGLTGTVASLEDDEKPENIMSEGDIWMPVHIHPNVDPPAGAKHTGTIPFKDPRRTPPRLFSAAFIVFASLISVAAISAALAAAILSVRWLVAVVS